MKVPSLKRIATHSPPAGQYIVLACVSGPRTVRNALPRRRVTTISQLHAAMEWKGPACSLWDRQTRSTNAESDGRSSKKMSMCQLRTRPDGRLAIVRRWRFSSQLKMPPFLEQMHAGGRTS